MRIETSFERAPYKWDHREPWWLVIALVEDDEHGTVTLSQATVDLDELWRLKKENDGIPYPTKGT